MTAILYGQIEAAHAAWADAATHAEPGAVRLLFTRGMKAVRGEMLHYLDERNTLTLEHAKRDDAGEPVPYLDPNGAAITGRVVLVDTPGYLAKLAALHAQSVDVALPALTEDLLTRTAASAESLAVLLDFLVSAP